MIVHLSKKIPFKFIKSFFPNKIIMYGHLISSSKQHPVMTRYKYPDWSIFDLFVDTMKNYGYKFVDFNDFITINQEKQILLTFDDGFKELLEMHKLLEKKKIPYAIFINQIEGQKDIANLLKVNDNDLFLTNDEILRLKNDGVHIGYHGNNHKNNIGKTLKLDEFETSFRIDNEVKKLLSTPFSFAYPFGAPTNHIEINQYLQDKHGFEYFFDTKAKMYNENNHYYRVSLDTFNDNKDNDFIFSNLKIAFVKSMLRRLGFEKY